MFRKNELHLQPPLISNINDLPAKHRQRLDESWAGVFYRDFFCRLKEESFAVLYADCPSRPNVPVNVLVGMEALKAGFGWSDEELYDHFLFDVQVRYALGYHNLNDGEFELRTLYNFRRRLSQQYRETDVNLLERAFEDITDQQIVAFKVKTGLQRMDSTQIASNILDMSRLQLLVESVQRVHGILRPADQARYAELMGPYLVGSSGQYVYRIKGREARDEHLRRVGLVIHQLLKALASEYGQEPVYQMLQRLFDEHFRVEAEVVQIRDSQEISAGCLQSLDDQEATFRRKGARGYKGYVANLAETCDPGNPLQLITKVQTAPNNTDDPDLMIQALPNLKQRTAVETLYTDGCFGSPAADRELNQHRVKHIQTGIRGSVPDPNKLSLSDFQIEQAEDATPTYLTCSGGQQVPVEAGHSTEFIAHFDPTRCQACVFGQEGRCRARPKRGDPRCALSFTQEEINRARRRQRYLENRKADTNLRAAVEATVRILKHPFRQGKLPVRGLFRVTCLLVGSATMVNVRRIQRYMTTATRDDPRPDGADDGQNARAISLLFPLIALCDIRSAHRASPRYTPNSIL
jgi:hypothetical protein